MNIFKKNLAELKKYSVLNTKKKKLLIYSIVAYYPAITLLVGSPYPDLLKDVQFPYSYMSLLSEELVKLIETLSTTLGLIGTVSIGVFWIHRQSNKKHEDTRDDIQQVEKELLQKIEELDDKFTQQICEKAEYLSRKMDKQKTETETLFTEKLSNLGNQIINIRDHTKELKNYINRVENNLFNLRGSGGMQD